MPRPLLAALLAMVLLLGLATLGVAWGQTGTDPSTVVVPAGGGSFVVNVSDLTFPGAVFLGFWTLARTLPAALRAWTPTLRVELSHRSSPDQD